MLGVLRQLQSRPDEAVSALSRASLLRPGDALIRSNLGSALRSNGEIDRAIKELERACALAPELGFVWFNLGKALKSNSSFDEARAALERAVALRPAHGAARIALAETLKAIGEIDASSAMYRSVLEAGGIEEANAWYGLANLKVNHFSETDAVQIANALLHSSADAEKSVQLGFALAKAQEDSGHHEQSFATLRDANSRKRGLAHWDRDAFSSTIDAMLEADRTSPCMGGPTLGEEVIFLMSLPRSGSTLAEQIIASHPMVEGAGELNHLGDIVNEESLRRGEPLAAWSPRANPDDWSRLGREYLARTERWRTNRPRSTDKGLNNWHHVGAAIRMLPSARFVFCRRDPVETVFACYRQLFANGQDFAYDLDDIASYWRNFDRVATEFSRHYSESMFEQIYEELVSDPEGQIRRLLETCNLSYDERCLRFHESTRHVRTASAAQVRLPLQRGTGRTAKYGRILDPVRASLGNTV